MLEDHVLDSSMDAMKIKIYLEFWHQDHWFEKMNMIWSRRRNEDGVLVWNSNKPSSSLCVKPWRNKILSVDFKRRIQVMALSRRHDRLMSWAMADQDLEHAIKWRVLYVPQDIVIEHVKIQDWPRWRAKIGFNIGQHMKHKECTTWDQATSWYGKPCQLCFEN